MRFWRSGTFWASAIFGWFVTLIALAILIAILGSHEMTFVEGIAVNVFHQLLSLLAGYAYGRRQFNSKAKTGRLSGIVTGGDRT